MKAKIIIILLSVSIIIDIFFIGTWFFERASAHELFYHVDPNYTGTVGVNPYVGINIKWNNLSMRTLVWYEGYFLPQPHDINDVNLKY